MGPVSTCMGDRLGIPGVADISLFPIHTHNNRGRNKPRPPSTISPSLLACGRLHTSSLILSCPTWLKATNYIGRKDQFYPTAARSSQPQCIIHKCQPRLLLISLLSFSPTAPPTGHETVQLTCCQLIAHKTPSPYTSLCSHPQQFAKPTTAQTQKLHWQHMSSLLSCTSQCPIRHDRRHRHRLSASAEEARVMCRNKSTILLLIVVCVDKRECRSVNSSGTIPRRKLRFSSNHRK
ncbi:unnamed protein product [Schistocephalus solidus]|uniref:Uncharacterized protein n=1 Tax=Schistocephalus solidus TaxID=70667 RepID=A0A183SC52_SCHSO|nr:unnamed protein product [Schistocephalus solidus]